MSGKDGRPEQQVQGWVREYINQNIEDVDEQPFLPRMIARTSPSQMSTEVDYLFFKTCYNKAQIKTFKEEACPFHRRSMLASPRGSSLLKFPQDFPAEIQRKWKGIFYVQEFNVAAVPDWGDVPLLAVDVLDENTNVSTLAQSDIQ